MKRLLFLAVLVGLVSGFMFVAPAYAWRGENVGPMVYTYQNPRTGTIYQPRDLPGFCTGAPCPWVGSRSFMPDVRMVPGPHSDPYPQWSGHFPQQWGGSFPQRWGGDQEGFSFEIHFGSRW